MGELKTNLDTIFPNVFVTVGTTSYDNLITWAVDLETQRHFEKMSVTHVKLQIGSSTVHHEGNLKKGTVSYELYKYKPNLTEDYTWADLIIGHAGAGTVLDVLDRGKTLFVIPNESLMDNHQIELGEFIHSEKYAYSCPLSEAHSILLTIRKSGLKPFASRNCVGFHQILEQTLNFDPDQLASAKVKRT